MTKQRVIPVLANKGFCPKIENIIVSGNSLVVLSTAQVIMSALTIWIIHKRRHPNWEGVDEIVDFL